MAFTDGEDTIVEVESVEAGKHWCEMHHAVGAGDD